VGRAHLAEHGHQQVIGGDGRIGILHERAQKVVRGAEGAHGLRRAAAHEVVNGGQARRERLANGAAVIGIGAVGQHLCAKDGAQQRHHLRALALQLLARLTEGAGLAPRFARAHLHVADEAVERVPGIGLLDLHPGAERRRLLAVVHLGGEGARRGFDDLGCGFGHCKLY